MSNQDKAGKKVANEEVIGAIKSIGKNRIAGFLVAFGSPSDKDLDGEFFTKDTNFELGWYGERPVLYNHGMDGSHKTKAIGKIDKIEIIDDAGLWAEAQLRDAFMYQDHVMGMIERRQVGWSSGSAPQYVEVDRNGFIRSWPIHEGSLTPMPAQPLKTTVSRIKHFSNVKTLKAAVDDLGLTYFNMDELMLKYNEDERGGDDEGNADATRTNTEAKADAPLKVDGRPIQIITNVYPNKDIKDNDMTDKDNVTPTPPDESAGKEANMPENPDPAPPIAGAPDTTVKEAPSQYIQDMLVDRVYSLEVDLSVVSMDEAIDKVKGWVMDRTLTSPVTQAQLRQARNNADFQKFLSDLVKSYVKEEPKQPEEDPYAKIAQLEAQMAQINNLIGKGGVSQLPNVDAKDADPGRSPGKWDSFYIEDYANKQNYGNYEFADLVQFATWKDRAVKRGWLDNSSNWSLAEDDALLNAIFQTGKDIVPEMHEQNLIANHNWLDRDNEHEPIYAVKAFQFMHNQRGKAIKANEVNNSQTSGRGSEWIWTMPDGNLWMTLVADTGLFNRFPRFNMVAGSVDMYIDDETGMPQVVPEVANSPADLNDPGKYPITPFGTAKVTFKARHIGQQTIISKVELEDSKIEPIRVARLQLENALRRGIDWTLINSDTPTTGNDNYGNHGAAPAANSLAAVGFQGLVARSLAPSTAHGGAAQGVDNGEACLSILQLRNLRRKLNSRYYADPQRLLLIMSPELRDRMMDIEEFQQTMIHSMGRFDGTLPSATFDRTPIVSSEQVVQRNEEGQLDAANAAHNTKEVAIFVRPDRWKVGIRRRMGRSMQEAGRFGEYLSVGASIRYDFQSIPHAKASGGDGAGGGSDTKRYTVATLYNVSSTRA